MSELQPDKTDAILGGQTPPPVNGVVLGNLSKFTIDLQSLLQQQKWQAADLIRYLLPLTNPSTPEVRVGKGFNIISGDRT